MVVDSSIFTCRNKKEGNVGIGKLPVDLHPILDDIAIEYNDMVSDKSKTTYHTYYTDLSGSLKSKFDLIQYNGFWNNIRDNNYNRVMQNVIEMNELYYSNPKYNFKSVNIYGAAANLIPHRDCVLFNFNGICLYRVIIGLTDYNNDTITEFINLNLEHKINKGDFMIFDFDKTLHQVKKTGKQETPRILLKLHFIVCENCNYSEEYVYFVSCFYKYYYYIARYTEQIGTDPTTFIGFFYGLLWEWPLYKVFKYIVFLLFMGNIVILNKVYKIKLTNTIELVLYSSTGLCFIYMTLVSFYYFRYILLRIK